MPLSESRLRQFGGTSGLWGGTCKPLEDYTFDYGQLIMMI